MKNQNTLNLTIKFTSLFALISLVDKLPKLHNVQSLQNTNDLSYLPYVLSQGIIDCIKIIKPDLQQRKAVSYTKSIALGLGIITSAYVSLSYNGINYIISFSFELLKNSATTVIIDKLNRLKTIDGVSIAVIMNLIFTIPNIIMGLSTKPLVIGLLFITSISTIAYGNYKLIQSTEDTSTHYHDKTDKFSLSTRNNYTTALIMSNFLTGLISNNQIIQDGILFIVNPLVQWFLSSSTVNVDDLNKYLQHNGIYINGLKHGKDTEDYIRQMIVKNSIKLGLVGAVTFILSSLLVKVFGISISPVMLSIAVNSFINVSFSVKTMIKSNSNLKGLSINVI